MPPNPTRKRCVHGRSKYQCRDCGTGLCSHGRFRKMCKECGTGVCAHARQKNKCKECGTGLCPHGIFAHKCTDCTPLHVLLRRPGYCRVCGVTRLTRNRRLGDRLCAGCSTREHARTEVIVRNMVMQQIPFPPSSLDNAFTGGCKGEPRRRPDMCWVMEDRLLHIEIDEHSHRDRTTSCELAKLDNTRFGAAAGLKAAHVFIRFNPDAYEEAKVHLTERVRVLVRAWHHFAKCPLDNFNVLLPNVCYLFYGQEGAKHVEAARASPSIHVLDYPTKYK